MGIDVASEEGLKLVAALIHGESDYPNYMPYVAEAVAFARTRLDVKGYTNEQLASYVITMWNIETDMGTRQNAESIVSSSGAIGLMQLMPDTFAELHKNVPFDSLGLTNEITDPRANIYAGTYYFLEQLAAFHDPAEAAAAYNWGANREVMQLAKGGGDIDTAKLPKEPLNYYHDFNAQFDTIAQLVADSPYFAPDKFAFLLTRSPIPSARPTPEAQAIVDLEPALTSSPRPMPNPRYHDNTPAEEPLIAALSPPAALQVSIAPPPREGNWAQNWQDSIYPPALQRQSPNAEQAYFAALTTQMPNPIGELPKEPSLKHPLIPEESLVASVVVLSPNAGAIEGQVLDLSGLPENKEAAIACLATKGDFLTALDNQQDGYAVLRTRERFDVADCPVTESGHLPAQSASNAKIVAIPMQKS